MHVSNIVAILTFAMTAAAAPSPVLDVRTGGGTQPACSTSGQKNVCCNGLLNCLVSIVGTNCDGSAYCCTTNQNTGALINISLLNCVNLF